MAIRIFGLILLFFITSCNNKKIDISIDEIIYIIPENFSESPGIIIGVKTFFHGKEHKVPFSKIDTFVKLKLSNKEEGKFIGSCGSKNISFSNNIYEMEQDSYLISYFKIENSLPSDNFKIEVEVNDDIIENFDFKETLESVALDTIKSTIEFKNQVVNKCD